MVPQFPGNCEDPGWNRHLHLNRYILMLGFLKVAIQVVMSQHLE